MVIVHHIIVKSSSTFLLLNMDTDYFSQYSKTYSEAQETAIAKEFKRIKDEHYLDHAASTMYSEKQLQDICSELASNIFSNPHGSNLASKQTEDAIDIVRFQILRHFHTNSEEYSVIFTSGATSSLKIIAEYFDYEKGEDTSGTFVFLEDNHTSVLGMRAYAENITLLNSSDAFNVFRETSELIPGNCKNNNSLFVYPAQSNFSGVEYPLHWIENVQRGILNRITEQKSQNWFVVLDAASYVSSNDLNLSLYKPDFVPISFYKIFGYPTGVGALLIRNKSRLALRKTYFGGGTVLMTLASENVIVPKTNLSDSFEDGSIPFLSILSIKHGLNTFKRLNLDFDVISKHTFSLAQYLFRNLLLLHHSTGKPAAIIYSDTSFERSEEQGGIVNFNLLNDTGEYIGYSQVLHMCNLHKIHVRTGCSCNPGACQRHLQLTSEDVKKHFQVGHVCGDDKDLIENQPTGSIRVSFGYMSKREDVDVLLNMIEDCFVSKPAIMKFPANWLEMKLSNAVKFSPIYHSDSPIHILNNLESCNQHSSKDKYMKGGSMNELDNYWRTTKECSFSNNNGNSILERILLYPIKSCGPYEPKSTWAISRVGLEYDRQWMIVNESGTCITQKHDNSLCLIKPRIDLVNNKLRIFFPKLSNISIPLIPTNNEVLIKHEGKVGADQVIGMDCGDAVAAWLTKCLNYPGLRLVQQIIDANGNNNRINRKGESVNLSLANKAQYLLINTATAQRLHEKIIDRNDSYEESLDSLILRFRPNFVMNLKEPFIENNCDILNFNGISFKVTQNCTRCQMVCINQINGEKSKEPLITLMRDFKGKGGVQFGVYLLLHDALNMYVSVGSKVFITEKKNE